VWLLVLVRRILRERITSSLTDRIDRLNESRLCRRLHLTAAAARLLAARDFTPTDIWHDPVAGPIAFTFGRVWVDIVILRVAGTVAELLL